MDFCDVCDGPASQICELCRDAVYCGEDCQRIDFEEHSKHDCFHPNDLTDEQINDEVEIYMECGIEPTGLIPHREWINGLFGTKESMANRKLRKYNRKKKRQIKEFRKKKKLLAEKKKLDKKAKDAKEDAEKE